MKGVGVMAFCLLLSLTVMSVTEGHVIRPDMGPWLRRHRSVQEVAQAEVDMAKRGWLKDKWEEFSENVDKSVKNAQKAVKEFWEKINPFDNFILQCLLFYNADMPDSTASSVLSVKSWRVLSRSYPPCLLLLKAFFTNTTMTPLSLFLDIPDRRESCHEGKHITSLSRQFAAPA
ncbi:hypothetical protein RRG08_009540 [Elysia crispata]|uniref:Uncharacterized protein n=1 Tax=Elysia crispata TaxID=231223 RepID=A0AAE1B209_9GAST|nr:hypothetical protein RRG08_009540 [Elysia crispata]